VVTNVPPLSWTPARVFDFEKVMRSPATGAFVRTIGPPPLPRGRVDGGYGRDERKGGKKKLWCALHPNRNRDVQYYQSYVSGFFTPCLICPRGQ
jgi:hypothetical protein